MIRPTCAAYPQGPCKCAKLANLAGFAMRLPGQQNKAEAAKRRYAKLIISHPGSHSPAFGIILKLSGSRNPAPAEKILPAPAVASRRRPISRQRKIPSAQTRAAPNSIRANSPSPQTSSRYLPDARNFGKVTSSNVRAHLSKNAVVAKPALIFAPFAKMTLPAARHTARRRPGPGTCPSSGEGASPEGRNALENFIFGD